LSTSSAAELSTRYQSLNSPPILKLVDLMKPLGAALASASWNRRSESSYAALSTPPE